MRSAEKDSLELINMSMDKNMVTISKGRDQMLDTPNPFPHALVRGSRPCSRGMFTSPVTCTTHPRAPRLNEPAAFCADVALALGTQLR